MQIMKKTVVALSWTMKDSLGEVLDTLDEPVEFYVGGEDLLPSIEAALLGKQPGDQVALYLEPEHGFGDYDENLVYWAARGLFPEDLEEGMVLEGRAVPEGTLDGVSPETLLTVTELYPEHVVLDGNHPLAGIALQLDLQVRSVRPSTSEEQHSGSAGVGFFKIAPDDPLSPPPTLH